MTFAGNGVGRRVRYWRLRRNLGRQRFADVVGRSVSWLDKVEAGERLLLRLPMLDRVAAALDIDASVLTDSSAAQRAAACVDTAEVQAIGRFRDGCHCAKSPARMSEVLRTPPVGVGIRRGRYPFVTPTNPTMMAEQTAPQGIGKRYAVGVVAVSPALAERPRKATSRSMAGASSAVGWAGPNRPVRGCVNS
jgi:transcriptional regulator with XRE-family HTH domain